MRCLAASTLKRRLLQFSSVPIRTRSFRVPRYATPPPCAELHPLLLPTVLLAEGCAVSTLCFVRPHCLRPLAWHTRPRAPNAPALLKSPLVQPRVTPQPAPPSAARVTLGGVTPTHLWTICCFRKPAAFPERQRAFPTCTASYTCSTTRDDGQTYERNLSVCSRGMAQKPRVSSRLVRLRGVM
jgi:hypothetical protein